jgi:hypothetical protein
VAGEWFITKCPGSAAAARHAGRPAVLALEYLAQEIWGPMSPSTSKPRRGRPPKPGDRVRVHAFVDARLAGFLERDAAANGIPKAEKLQEILAAWYSGEGAMPKAS